METRARHVLIGLFTLTAAIVGVLLALWLGRSQSASNFHDFDIVFEEAVSGLSRGSMVEFNGIRVGDVIELRLDPQKPRKVFARVRVESSAPVRTDTRATLMPVGVTGTSLIRLSSGDDPASKPLLGSARAIPVIQATPSPMSKMLAGGGDVLYNFNELLVTARKVFSEENIEHLNKTFENIEQSTGALAEQRETLAQAVNDLGQATAKAKAAFGEMEKLMQTGNQMASGDLKQTLARANNAMAAFEKSMNGIEVIVQENRAPINTGVRSMAQFGPTFVELRGTLNALQDVMRQFDNDPARYLLNREPMKEFTP